MRLPVPSFNVLLYGPNLPLGGLKARAHFEDQVLVVQAKGHWFTILGNRLDLSKGGFDGHQWLLCWMTPSGQAAAILQGVDAVEAFIKMAPPLISQDLRLKYRALSGKDRSPVRDPKLLLVFALLLLTLLVMLWEWLG